MHWKQNPSSLAVIKISVNEVMQTITISHEYLIKSSFRIHLHTNL